MKKRREKKGSVPQSFYRDFENIHRGPRIVVKDRLRVYLDFLEPFKTFYPKEALNVLDIGCGRGEFVELLSENGFVAKGVDIDKDMLKEAKRLGLNVTLSDGLDFVRSMPDSYFIAVSAIHVVEHLAIEDVIGLIKESKRVLKPGGLLIIETPNPENVRVSTSSFWLDPTHIRPINADFIGFVVDYFGYRRKKLLRINEDASTKSSTKNFLDLFVSVSPDYSLIAQKDADKEILALFDSIFEKEYGISLEQISSSLSSSFDHRFKDLEEKLSEQIEQRISDLEEKLSEQIEQSISKFSSSYNHRFKDLEHRFSQQNSLIEQRISSLEQSLSEQTATILATKAEIGALLYSKPWRYYQFLGKTKRNLFGLARSLRQWLRAKYVSSETDIPAAPPPPNFEQAEGSISNFYLTPRGFKIYMDLKKHIAEAEGSLNENIS